MQIDFDHFENFWRKQQETAVHMDEEALREHIMKFIDSHNTCALATGHDDQVRCTPIEYTYADNAFWFFTEGGEKFANLRMNRHVSLAIYEPFRGNDDSHGLQVAGTVDFFPSDSPESKKILATKGIPYEVVENAPVQILLLKVVPERFEMYDTDFIPAGLDIRQSLEAAGK